MILARINNFLFSQFLIFNLINHFLNSIKYLYDFKINKNTDILFADNPTN